MIGVYVPDADTLRRLIPDVQRLLKWPYCAYLFFLARHVDEDAIAFLQRYAQALHIETGEAIAVIVLFDDIKVLGYVGHFGRRPDDLVSAAEDQPQQIEDQEIVYGTHPFATHSIPDIVANIVASPEWSLKFADRIGLSRSFLPCLVAFDHVPDAKLPGCVVVDLSDPDLAWQILRDSIASFMTTPAGSTFARTAGRLREVERKVESARLQMPRVPTPKMIHWPARVAPTPQELLRVLSQSNLRVWQSALDAIAWWSEKTDTADALKRVLTDTRVLRALLNHEDCVEHLRHKWLVTSFPLGSAPGGVVRRLADCLRILDQEPSRLEVDRILTADLVERSRFLEAVERVGHADLSAIAQSLQRLKETTAFPGRFATPEAEEAHREAEEAYDTASRRLWTLRREARALRDALISAPFLPHLAAAIPSQAGTGAHRVAVPELSKVAAATNIGASVVQILKDLKVIR